MPDESPAAAPASARLTRGRLWAALGVVAAMTVAATLTVLRTSRDAPDSGVETPLPPPRVAFEAADVSASDFLGSEACASCHRAAYDTWRGSTHAAAGGAPGSVRLLKAFDGTPMRFRDGVVVPERRGNTWQFVVRQEGRPERTYRVDGVVGGGHMQGGGTQGFVSRLADGTLRFLPFDFIRREATWFCNTGSRANRGWVPITPDLRLADCGDWPPQRVLGDELRFTNCQSCHGSQIEVSVDSAARTYRTRYASLGIDCESCHGPGRRHVALVGDPAAVARGEIGMTPLATLAKDASLGTCFQCHALKDQLRPGYRAGRSLTAYYSLQLPQLGDAAHLPDGRVRTFAYQEGHLFSDCYVNGGMTCTSCHDPHSQGYRDVQGRPLVGRFDDRQCTSCHASKATQVSLHTNHPADSPGSRCVACHMPYLQEPEVGTALQYARSDHAIPIPRPLADSALGVRSACRSCHADRSEAALDQQVRSWYRELKPIAPTIASVLEGRETTDAARAATTLLLPDAPHTAAQFVGLALFTERFLTPNIPLQGTPSERLRRLAADRDLDVRAVALAALHYTGGARARGFLATQLGDQGSDEPLVRSRWATTLGFLADRQREAGDPVAAVTTYQKALEIEPRNPRIHLNHGLALANAGRLPEAIAAYDRSLTLDAAQPLAWVNMGIARAASGDAPGAVRAYERALAINAREPLAHFNLGNLRLESGQLDAASASYRAALAADPSLALARFYLARILAQRGDLRGALAEVDAGLEFDPTNAEAQAARAQLTAMIAGVGRPAASSVPPTPRAGSVAARAPRSS
ncbi:MAG: tetratricopeptide repeat protein [Gemmatimonadaceae bacterium]|nr:tetratricopeptide repeat protein [Gemmatimonadaceae bacterium]